MGSALAVNWDEIRKASEQGVDDMRLCEAFEGLTRESIRVRRHREKWLTPAKIEQEAIIQAARDRAGKIGNQSVIGVTSVTGGSVTGKMQPSALSVTAETLQDRASAYSLRMFDYASGQVEKAVKAELVPTPDDWKSLDTADRMVRRAAGLDKADSQSVTVNLGGWQAAVTAQGVTAQFREVEQVLDGEDCAQEAQDEPEE